MIGNDPDDAREHRGRRHPARPVPHQAQPSPAPTVSLPNPIWVTRAEAFGVQPELPVRRNSRLSKKYWPPITACALRIHPVASVVGADEWRGGILGEQGDVT